MPHTTEDGSPLINSMDCSSDGSKIVGINYVNKELYLSTDSGKSFIKKTIGSGNYIQVRMTSDEYFFTVLDYDGNVYTYNITNLNTITTLFNGGIPKSLRCLSISSNGTKQFVFTSSGSIIIIVNFGILNPLATPLSISPNVVWDSCECSSDVNSSDGNKQIAVGFVLNGKVYDCYVFLTTDTWTNYKSAKIERRAKTPNNINYEEDRASGTTSFMSSDGSKKWCIIDDQLYYNNTDNVNNFVLVSKPDDFISYGTCSPDGSIVYLIKKDGSLWKSIYNGTTLTPL